jgi:hypothetical protein
LEVGNWKRVEKVGESGRVGRRGLYNGLSWFWIRAFAGMTGKESESPRRQEEEEVGKCGSVKVRRCEDGKRGRGRGGGE